MASRALQVDARDLLLHALELARHRGSDRRGGASPRRAASDRSSAARGSAGSSPSPWRRWHSAGVSLWTSHRVRRQIPDGRRRSRRRLRAQPARRGHERGQASQRRRAQQPRRAGGGVPHCGGSGGRRVSGVVLGRALRQRRRPACWAWSPPRTGGAVVHGAEREARLHLVGGEAVLLLLELLHGDLREVVALLLLRPPPGASAARRCAAFSAATRAANSPVLVGTLLRARSTRIQRLCASCRATIEILERAVLLPQRAP